MYLQGYTVRSNLIEPETRAIFLSLSKAKFVGTKAHHGGVGLDAEAISTVLQVRTSTGGSELRGMYTVDLSSIAAVELGFIQPRKIYIVYIQ